ncbi:MAG: tetratricopeptide repeat protein [bacterium]|nr:tetratricopeptide repeat protein [bacterium]
MLSLLIGVFLFTDLQELLFQKGINYYNSGKYDSSIVMFKQAIKEDSTSKDAYFNLGASFGKIRKYDDAIISFNKAISLSPNDLDALFQLGAMCIVKGDYKSAVVVYTRIISFSPQLPRAYENRGTAYWKLGLQKQANADLKTAKRLRRGEPVKKVSISIPVMTSKGVKLPEIAIEDTITADSADIELLPYIGEIYMTTGDYELAVVAYSKLIKLAPNNPKGYRNRALAYEKLGKQERVKKDRDKLQKLLIK